MGASFLAGRAALLVVVFLARAFVPERAPNDDKDFVAFPSHPLWDSFCRWDSGWYDRIARLGYFRSGTDGQSDVAFFPAFPYLSRWLGPVFGGHWAAGLVISNLSLFGALYFVHALGERHAGEGGGRRAVWLVLLYPATVFYSAYYTEGLFLFAVLGAFHFYEQDDMRSAGLLGALAAMTRPVGVLLLPALLLGKLRRARWRPAAVSPRVLWLGLVLVGFGVVLATYAVQVGDPLAFVTAEARWGHAPTMPLVTLVRAARQLGHARAIDVLDLVAALALFPVAFVARKRIDLAQALFTLACVALPLCSGMARSIERYAACVPAVFLVLALATRRRAVAMGVFLVFAALMVLQTTLFVSWYWAG